MWMLIGQKGSSLSYQAMPALRSQWVNVNPGVIIDYGCRKDRLSRVVFVDNIREASTLRFWGGMPYLPVVDRALEWKLVGLPEIAGRA
jgi:hypothetical protein